MTNQKSWISTFAAVALLALPTWASAAPLSAACNVEINYLVNGTLVEAYTKDFMVTRRQTFVDDFSTATREKTFSASLAREAGKAVVSIDYFNDVGTFVAISLDTSVSIRGVGVIETTAGSHTYSSSRAVPAGNHTTNHTLVCSRQ